MPERRRRTPSQVAVLIGLFCVAYGVYATAFTAEPHWYYAAFIWALSAVWFGLAWLARDKRRP